MINSNVDYYIDKSSIVKDSILGINSKVWKNSFIKNSKIGENVSIGDFSRIENSELNEYVNIQRNNLIYDTSISRYSYTGKNFTCWHSSIGSFCSISWNVSIGGANHDYNKLTTSAFLYSNIFDLKGSNVGYDRFDTPCTIGNDVWIGCGATICRNVKVGDGAVIAANAVVTKDVEPYSIVAGIPARHIKYRFPKNIVDALLIIKWWTFPKGIIIDNYNLFNSVPNDNTIQQLMDIRLKLNGKL